MLKVAHDAAPQQYDVLLPSREQRERFDRMYGAGVFPELIDPHTSLEPLHGYFPTPPKTPWPKPKLGSIYWPVVGLARYAFAVLLLDEFTVGKLRQYMDSSFKTWVTLKFTDDPDDEAETPHEFVMHWLAARPLVRTGSDPLTATDEGEQDAWVVILVDSRYKLLQTSTGIDSFSFPPTTWQLLYDTLLFSLPSLTITDAFDADYLSPNLRRWSNEQTALLTWNKMAGKSLPWLCDIAAMCVGSRIVRIPPTSTSTFANTTFLQRPTATHAATLASAHATAVSEGRYRAGGPIADDDVRAGLASAARVWFGRQSVETATPVDVIIHSDPADNGSITHWADVTIEDSDGIQRLALAQQWADDWYAWQFNQVDAVYNGFVPVPQTSFLWAVEWTHTREDFSTKFYRTPHGYGYLLPPHLHGHINAGISASDPNTFTAPQTFDEGIEVTTPSTFDAELTTDVPITITGTVGQTANLLELRDSVGNLVLGVGIGSGYFTTDSTFEFEQSATFNTDLTVVGDIAAGNFDNDAALAANSATRLPTQQAVKGYVDARIDGRAWKQSARAATTAAGTLATDFENGDTIDGVVLATGDRILIKNQAAAADNGIYVVAAAGAPTRASDANTGDEILAATVVVTEGTANADSVWTCTTNAPITIGVTNLAFAQIAGTGSGGITQLTGDVTAGPGSGSVAATIPNDTVTYAKMQNVSATARILGRKTAAAGDVEECTLSETLDMIGSAARGDILVRGAASWQRLALGPGNTILRSDGTDVVWGIDSTLLVATQAEVEAGILNSVAISPGRQQFHSSAAKGWVYSTVSGGTPSIAASYNAVSITDNGVGDFTVNWDADFTNSSYANVAWAGGAGVISAVSGSQAAGTTQVRVLNTSFALTDPTSFGIVAYGDRP